MFYSFIRTILLLLFNIRNEATHKNKVPWSKSFIYSRKIRLILVLWFWICFLCQHYELRIASKLLEHIIKEFDLKHELLNKILKNGTDILGKEVYLLREAKYLVNHPPHVHNHDKINPSSFIPFCKYGGNFSLINTITSNLFPLPTCNAFKPILLEGQVYIHLLQNYSNKWILINKSGLLQHR